MIEAESIVRALGGQWNGYNGMALCPAHEDRNPSLSIGVGDNGRTLLNCFAGCAYRDIVAALSALGIELRNTRSIGEVVSAIRRKHENARNPNDAIARRVWDNARPIANTDAELYLRGRGIACELSRNLRFDSRCYYGPGRFYPAMIARVENPRGFGIHRTYLQAEKSLGQRRVFKADLAPAKMMLGTTRGGAVCLGDGDLIAIAEGIETALSLGCGFLNEPAKLLAALSASNLANIELPLLLGRLVIAADGDNAGRIAAGKLAARARSLGWAVDVMAAPDGLDWNDVLRGAA